MATEKVLRLILGDQLNRRHAWFGQPRPEVVFTMMEVRQETDYVRHHIPKRGQRSGGNDRGRWRENLRAA